MSHTTGRKRRRWLIVLLVLASPVAWWYWPRGDARFVGTWQRIGGQATNASELLLTSIDLRANGTGRCTGQGISEMMEFHFPWRVEGEVLVLGRERDSWVSPLLDELDRFTFTRFGYQQLPIEWRFEIRGIRSDELRLENSRSPEDRIFRRS